MEFTYKFAKETSKNYPQSWNMNGSAGEQWLTDFMKRNSKVFPL
jgi:hypothetical protein